jgi:transcription elongation GreA/GreB family factor
MANARSQGDLRENFGFHAAKEKDRVLRRRKAEMERDLARAQGTDFANPDTSRVNIGTVVRLRRADGSETTFTLLGAWDSEPDRHIVSYKTSIGQALLGKAVGEQAEIPAEHGSERVEIVSITAWSPAAVQG